MIKRQFIAFFLLISPIFLTAQDLLIQKDSIAHYNYGRLYNKSKITKRHVLYQNNTFLLQEAYPNGNLAKEYFRDNDSLFLFKEYYDTLKSNGRQVNKSEGLLLVSNKTQGDTIITYDYGSSEQVTLINRLLIPIEEWTFFDDKGKLLFKGTFSEKGKEGEWHKFSSTIGHLSEVYHYKNDLLEQIDTIDVLLHQNKDITKLTIEGSWSVTARFDDGKYILSKHPDMEGMKRIGKVIYFEQNNLLIGRTTGNNPSPKVNLKIKRKWSMQDYSTILITNYNSTSMYKIEYLSTKSLWLKKT